MNIQPNQFAAQLRFANSPKKNAQATDSQQNPRLARAILVRPVMLVQVHSAQAPDSMATAAIARCQGQVATFTVRYSPNQPSTVNGIRSARE